MDLGLDFDDDDFDIKKESRNDKKKSYNAKFCSDFWYYKYNPEPENAGVIFKFRGDDLYHKRCYLEAIEFYKEGLESLPLNNKALRQDILECMARCYLYLEKNVEALDIAHRLISDAKSFDQTMQTRLLLCQIQEKMNDIEGQEESLKILLTMHPFTYSCWMKLGHCYQIRLEQSKDTYTDSLKLKRLSCLVRVRLLLRNILRNSSSFLTEKLQRLVKETEDEQSMLEAPDHIVNLATKYLKEDISQSEDEQNEELIKQIDEGGVQSDVENFDQRWFSWIQNENLVSVIK